MGELRQAHALAHFGVLLAQQAHVRRGKQFLLEKAGALQVGKVAHGQIGLARFQCLGCRFAGHGQRLQIDVRGLAGEFGQQSGQEIHLGNIGGDERKWLGAGARIEARRLQDVVCDLLHHIAHAGLQRSSPRGWRHALACAHKQRIAEQMAQPGQGRAHGGLAQAE